MRYGKRIKYTVQIQYTESFMSNHIVRANTITVSLPTFAAFASIALLSVFELPVLHLCGPRLLFLLKRLQISFQQPTFFQQLFRAQLPVLVLDVEFLK